MRRAVLGLLVLGWGVVLLAAVPAAAAEEVYDKPAAEEVLLLLKAGNQRFALGQATYPHADAARRALAGRENQAKYALATVLSCSDSRVPVELIFDAGVMDLFVVRVAGNVCDTDEIGSIEYGLAHVRTPLLVILGHTQCGAVTAVTRELHGHGHKLERNIPPLVENIAPAVKRVMKEHRGLSEEGVVPLAIVENVWQSVEELFLRSPAVREMVQGGKVRVVGAVYDISAGTVTWLDEARVGEILARASASPRKQG